MENVRLDSHPKWHSIRQGRGEQLHLVRQLHFDAGNVLFFSLSLSHTHYKVRFVCSLSHFFLHFFFTP